VYGLAMGLSLGLSLGLAMGLAMGLSLGLAMGRHFGYKNIRKDTQIQANTSKYKQIHAKTASLLT